MQPLEHDSRKMLARLRREFDEVKEQIDEMSMNNSVTDLKLGHLLKRQHELEKQIKTLEKGLIPDMPA